MIGGWLIRKARQKYLSYMDKNASDLWDFNTRRKIVDKVVKGVELVINILLTLFLYYFFSRMVYDKIGFEKIVILLLVLIFMRVMLLKKSD